MVVGVTEGSARTSTSWASATAPRPKGKDKLDCRSASRTRSWSRRRTASSSSCPSPPASRCTASTSSSSARWPPTSVAPQAGALQGQGRPLRRRAGAAQGRKGWQVDEAPMSDKAQRSARRVSVATPGCASRSSGTADASPPRGVPFQPPRRGPGHRRRHRAHRWPRPSTSRRTCAARRAPTGRRGQGRRARGRAGQGGRRRPRSCSTAAATYITGASPPSPTRPVKQDWSSDGSQRQGRPAAARIAGHQHQPRRQGGQGRPPLLLHRARGDR